MNQKHCNKQLKKKLDTLYRQYHQRKYVHPDPLEFLYNYEDIAEREIVGLIAASLAYGRVNQILKSIVVVLEKMNPSPARFLAHASPQQLRKTFSGFTHRFATGNHLADFLIEIKGIIHRFGSLNQCFISGISHNDQTLIPAMTHFSTQLTRGNLEGKTGGKTGIKKGPGHLVAHPEKGSACKRMNLFLRWMIRKDRVDPGGWVNVPKSKLIVPIDTHMHRISLKLGFTKRKQANMATALEITSAFKEFSPRDPVRYDFSLTRLGIREELDIDRFFDQETC